MKWRVVRADDGTVIGAVATEPNPAVFVEPDLEEGQQLEEVDRASADLAELRRMFESSGQGN
jgi:hypothetical protein